MNVAAANVLSSVSSGVRGRWFKGYRETGGAERKTLRGHGDMFGTGVAAPSELIDKFWRIVSMLSIHYTIEVLIQLCWR